MAIFGAGPHTGPSHAPRCSGGTGGAADLVDRCVHDTRTPPHRQASGQQHCGACTREATAPGRRDALERLTGVEGCPRERACEQCRRSNTPTRSRRLRLARRRSESCRLAHANSTGRGDWFGTVERERARAPATTGSSGARKALVAGRHAIVETGAQRRRERQGPDHGVSGDRSLGVDVDAPLRPLPPLESPGHSPAGVAHGARPDRRSRVDRLPPGHVAVSHDRARRRPARDRLDDVDWRALPAPRLPARRRSRHRVRLAGDELVAPGAHRRRRGCGDHERGRARPGAARARGSGARGDRQRAAPGVRRPAHRATLRPARRAVLEIRLGREAGRTGRRAPSGPCPRHRRPGRTGCGARRTGGAPVSASASSAWRLGRDGQPRVPTRGSNGRSALSSWQASSCCGTPRPKSPPDSSSQASTIFPRGASSASMAVRSTAPSSTVLPAPPSTCPTARGRSRGPPSSA